MTLARYTGPRRAHVGAIGEAADGGVVIGGRLVPGTCEPVVWRVTLNGETVSRGTWIEGASVIAAATGIAWNVDPCAAGVETVDGDDVWRMEPE